MKTGQLILDHIYDHEISIPDHTFLVQPLPDGRLIEYTWARMMVESRRMAAHLKSLGLAPGARVAVLAKNSAHFFMTELAVWMAGGTTVAIFPNERPEYVRFILEHSGACLLFIGKLDNWPDQAAILPAGLPCISLPLAPATEFDFWESIVARSDALTGRPPRDPADLGMLLYTSGSTGQPKGVMHNFGRISDASERMYERTLGSLPEGAEVRRLSYLPLAHAYERATGECTSFVKGDCVIHFNDSPVTFTRDIQRVRPTVFCSVPRLWFKFQQGVFAKLPAAQLDACLADPKMAPAVSRQVLESLGLDQVLKALTGSAPIPIDLLNWYRRLGLNLIEGYAMTEDFCYSHLGPDEGSIPGYVGRPCEGVEVRLDPNGEILIKSPGQMVGYYQRPDLDAVSFTPDGFFRTGDIGEVSPDGQLKLVGRAKEIFKTAKGKYVAPAPIESYLNAHRLVDQALVSGSGRAAPFAVVVLTETKRTQPDLGVQKLQLEVELARLRDDINSQLSSYERLQMLVVLTDPWSIENGCLTPTLKLKRHRIEAAIAPQIDAWYSRPEPVIWL